MCKLYSEMPVWGAVTRPWCPAGCVAPWLIPVVTLQEQSSTSVVSATGCISNTRGAGVSQLPVHCSHSCLPCQLHCNLREKGIVCFTYSCGISAGCLLFSAPLACVGHPPLSGCLPLQLLQSLHSSLRHGPHLFSANLLILARMSLWKRGQNKPHVSFNDILKISITGRFLYYIKYACMSKWKVYVKKNVFWSSATLPLA